MNYPIVKNTCLKCGAVRYEPQNFLVMCKVCDCIIKDRKPDDRNNLPEKAEPTREDYSDKGDIHSPQTKPDNDRNSLKAKGEKDKLDKTGDHIQLVEDKAK